MAESAPQPPKDDIEAAATQEPVQIEIAPADGDRSSSSNKDKEQTYERHLYDYIKMDLLNLRRHPKLLDFQKLSLMNIVHLTNELAKYDQAIEKDEAAPQDIERVGDLLHRYTTAVRDREYWLKLPTHGGHGSLLLTGMLRQHFPNIYHYRTKFRVAKVDALPKSTSGSIDPLRNFLKRVLPRRLTWTNDERKRRADWGYVIGRIPEDTSPFVDTLARFIVAITGGLSLVVPMLVMRLDEHLKKSLITVSVAVILFSILTALMFKASNVETLAATATYAAVLVVFVGTST